MESNMSLAISGGNGNSLVQFQADPASVAAAERERAEIQAAYTMALHNPRSIEECRVKILAACSRPGFAAKCIYSLPRGKDKIEGPTIRMMEEISRNWKNLRCISQVIFEDEDNMRFRAGVLDLESNNFFGQEQSIRKTVERSYVDEKREIVSQRTNSLGKNTYIVRATEEEFRSKMLGSVSRILRNEIKRAIPFDIVEEAMERARETMSTTDAKDVVGAIRKMADEFVKIGISPAQLEKYLGHPLTENITTKEIADLRAIYSGISSGEATWKDFYSEDVTDSEKTAEKSNEKLTELKTKMEEKKKKKEAEVAKQQQTQQKQQTPSHDPVTGEVKEEVIQQQTSAQAQEPQTTQAAQVEDKPPFDETSRTTSKPAVTPAAATNTQNGNGSNGVKRTRGL